MVSLIRYFFVVINIFHVAIGALMVGFGAWLRLSSPLREILLSDNASVTSINFIIATGVFLLLFGGLGVMGNAGKNKKILGAYLGISIVMLILEITVLAYGYSQSNDLKNYGSTLWLSLSLDVKNAVQSRFNCCGYIDPSEWNNQYPDSCLSNTTNTDTPWPVGCYASISSWLDQNAFVIAGLAATLLVITLLQTIISSKLLYNEVKQKSKVEDSSHLVPKNSDEDNGRISEGFSPLKTPAKGTLQ